MSIQGSDVREKNLRFYNERVAPMIREQFPEYEKTFECFFVKPDDGARFV